MQLVSLACGVKDAQCSNRSHVHSGCEAAIRILSIGSAGYFDTTCLYLGVRTESFCSMLYCWWESPSTFPYSPKPLTRIFEQLYSKTPSQLLLEVRASR